MRALLSSFRPSQPGFDPGESRNPVTEAVLAYTPAVDYWVPARASPVKSGSLGRDDGHSYRGAAQSYSPHSVSCRSSMEKIAPACTATFLTRHLRPVSSSTVTS